MWCACPTRSPHSPSASSCPKPIPLLNLRPSPVEWAPYPTARTVPRMCERFFCTPAQVTPAFLRQVSTFLPRASASPFRSSAFARQVPTSARTSSSAEPKTRSFSRRAPAFPLRSPAFAHEVPTSARTSPTAEPKIRSFSRRSSIRRHAPAERGGKAPHRHDAPPGGSTPSPHPTQKRPNLTPSRRKNVTLSTHSF